MSGDAPGGGTGDGAAAAGAPAGGDAVLSLSVTTAVAHAQPLAAAVAQLLALLAPGADRDAIETALQEAVANAVIHGNLGLASMAVGTPEEMRRFAESLAERLSDPALAGRRVTVGARMAGSVLRLEVSDEGSGYAAVQQKPGQPFGRGLGLVSRFANRCEVSDGGRRLSMEFDL